MTPLVFNYQVGNPNATFPASLTVKSSDAGVSINALAPTHRYVAFGLASTPPLPPSPGYLLWVPTDIYVQYYTTNSVVLLSATNSEFQTVDPTTVGVIGFVSYVFGENVPITSLSNFAPYTNLSFIYTVFTFITEINLEDIQLKGNPVYPVSPEVDIEYNLSLSSISNLPTFLDVVPQLGFYGNNLPKTSIDNILIEADNLGGINTGGTLDISNGGGLGNNDTFTPGGAGESAYNNLISKSWTVFTNSGGLPQLNTSDNGVNSIFEWIYNGAVNGITSVDSFNSNVQTYQGITRLTFSYFSVPIDLTYINNLNSYISLFELTVIGYPSITNLDITYLLSLQYLTIAVNSNLTSLYVNKYYKNLTNVNLNSNALDQTSVNNILIALDNNGKLNGNITITGGTNSAPNGDGLTAKNNLIAKGWAVATN